MEYGVLYLGYVVFFFLKMQKSKLMMEKPNTSHIGRVTILKANYLSKLFKREKTIMHLCQKKVKKDAVLIHEPTLSLYGGLLKERRFTLWSYIF